MTNPITRAGEAVPEGQRTESPMTKANRLGWELARTLNDYAGGMFKAIVFPTSVHPEFAVGFRVLNLPSIPDPLFDAIQAYREGYAKFAAIPDERLAGGNEEKFVMETYGEHLDTLEAWDKPALTREGAIAALELIEDKNLYDGCRIEPLLRAVRGYLEALEGAL